MNFVEFTAAGHQNIRATHKNTLEFTKHSQLTLDGDCIIAVNADFDGPTIKKLVTSCDKIKITITADEFSDTVEALINKKFDSDEEIVVRLGEFDSQRTLGIRATKAALHIKRELVEKLRNPLQKILVRIEAID